MVFPEQRITPSKFRRIIATAVFQSRVKDSELCQRDFVEQLTVVMNNSYNVSLFFFFFFN